jgi:hypothetical protein
MLVVSVGPRTIPPVVSRPIGDVPSAERMPGVPAAPSDSGLLCRRQGPAAALIGRASHEIRG